MRLPPRSTVRVMGPPDGVPPEPPPQQIEFILEIDRLKSVVRRASLLDRSRRENTAEHSWQIALMAVLLAGYADPQVDINRVVIMLLVHDLVEIDAGDTPIYDEQARATQSERERRAADRIFGLLPPGSGPAAASVVGGVRGPRDSGGTLREGHGQIATTAEQLLHAGLYVERVGSDPGAGDCHQPADRPRLATALDLRAGIDQRRRTPGLSTHSEHRLTVTHATVRRAPRPPRCAHARRPSASDPT